MQNYSPSIITASDKDKLFENIKDDVMIENGLPLFEIIASLKPLENKDCYLLDGSVYNKITNKDLYSVFGDNYATHANRPLNDGEFALPNLSGRYIVGRDSEGRGFDTSDEAIQAFALESTHYFGYNPLNNVVKKYFKSTESSDTISINSDKVIKKIVPYNTDMTRKSVSIDDKCFLFYIKKV